MKSMARLCDCGRHSMGRARYGVIEETLPSGVIEVHRSGWPGYPQCYIYNEATDDLRWLPTREDVPA